MLTNPSYVIVLHVPSNVLQEGSLYDLPTDWSEADQPVVPEIDLLACSEDECNICLPLVIGEPSPIYMSFRDGREKPCKDVISSVSTLGCNLLSPMNSCGSSLQALPDSVFICCWWFSSSLNPFTGGLGEAEAKKTLSTWALKSCLKVYCKVVCSTTHSC